MLMVELSFQISYTKMMAERFKNPTLSGKSFFWLGLILVAFGISRYLPLDHPSLFNFSPALSIFLVSGAYLKGKLAWALPVIAVFITDLFMNHNHGLNFLEPFMIVTLFSYSLVFIIGRKTGNQSSITKILGAGIASALLFHTLTCSFAWAYNPAYLKSFSGWLQALFIGEPGYAPSYLFLRNSILSTVFFSVLLTCLVKFLCKQQSSAPATANSETVY